ncbi:MAG TPA: HEXXH motif-containing putative peptide modification protein [Pseudonocardiaceae bacterium]|nr:HEXXH motif-containing putative peptide modification protein [Pseudonocardiaceae bacterium]
MTTPSLPSFAAHDIPAMHAAIATPSVLQRERRALYQLAAELLEHGDPPVLDLDVIDSPLARHRIGDALAGHANFVSSMLVGINALAASSSTAHDLRVVSRPEANALLAAALWAIGAELEPAFCPPALLTEADGERFTSALAMLRSGVALARSVSAELIDDLLAHIALVGVLDPKFAGRLVSASPRAYPGLVLLKAPRSSIAVAEALVHEGAHQKLFDLAITHDLLSADSDRCPPFHPPWAPQQRRWPLEQTLAACHAYACLARFGDEAGVAAGSCPPSPESLLPVAMQRCKILGHWLLDQGDYLGVDAHLLLDGLIGRRPSTSRTAANRLNAVAADYIIDTPLEFRRCGSPDRVLVGRPSQPPQLYWVTDDAATVLELLTHESLDDVAHTFAQRWSIQQLNATDRLSGLLSDLYLTGLVTIRDTSGITRN